MTQIELEMELSILKERVQILEEARRHPYGWSPRSFPVVSRPGEAGDLPPFHDPVLE